MIAYKTLADLAGKGAMFVITIVAARQLSPQAFGVFALGSTLGWLTAVASDFGMQMHIARAIAREPAAAASLLAVWLRARAWSAAMGVLVVTAGLAIVGRGTPAFVPIAMLVLAYACGGLVEFLHYCYRGLSRSDLESTLTLWQRGGTLVCGVAALAWRPDVTVLGVAMLIPAIATLIASLRIARSLVMAHQDPPLILSPSTRPAHPEPVEGKRASLGMYSRDERVDPLVLRQAQDERTSVWRVFGRDVWPIGAGILLSALYFRIDVFLVQRWSGTEAVALYNAVFRLVEALRLFPAAVLAVMLPALCRATNLQILTRTATRLTLAAVCASAALWAAAGWLIPFLYGDAYRAAVPVFRILLLAFPLLSLNNALTMQLVGWNGQRAFAGLCGVALVTNLALNAWLIPSQSIAGAAWATLGTEVVLTIGCVIALHKHATAPRPAPLHPTAHNPRGAGPGLHGAPCEYSSSVAVVE